MGPHRPRSGTTLSPLPRGGGGVLRGQPRRRPAGRRSPLEVGRDLSRPCRPGAPGRRRLHPGHTWRACPPGALRARDLGRPGSTAMQGELEVGKAGGGLLPDRASPARIALAAGSRRTRRSRGPARPALLRNGVALSARLSVAIGSAGREAIGSRSWPLQERCAAHRGWTPIRSSSADRVYSRPCGPRFATPFWIWPREWLLRWAATDSRCSSPRPKHSAVWSRKIKPR